jgi:hypothetical protein
VKSPWGHRIVAGLESAERCERPDHIPKSLARGTKAFGLSFERAVARALPGAVHGPWYEFWDRDGKGYCQPDLVLVLPRLVLVIECKLSDTPAARAQLNELYLPVCAKAHGRPAQGLVIVKHLKPDSTHVFSKLSEALQSLGVCPCLHWIGRGALG